MTSFLTTTVIGILLVVLGAINMTGNISSLHHYHRKRVSEENRKPFGRLVGLGTIIVGVSLIAFGALYLLYERTGIAALSIVATACLIVGIVVGLVLNFYAMIKYNGGIF